MDGDAMIRFIRRFLSRGISSLPPQRPMFPTLNQQIAWESQGAQAGRIGKSRSDCPYMAGTAGWNHWIFGYDNATSPVAIGFDGTMIMSSTSSEARPPADYLLKYPDGRITTRDGKSVSIMPKEQA